MSLFQLLNESELGDAVRAAVAQAQRNGAPDPNLYKVLAHRPELAVTFAAHWDEAFQRGIIEHRTKELARLKVVAVQTCGYCGRVRSTRAIAEGMTEEDVQAVVNHRESGGFSPREKAAMNLAERLAGNASSADVNFYDDLRQHFTDPEIIELSWLVGLCVGLGRVVSTWHLSPVRCEYDVPA